MDDDKEIVAPETGAVESRCVKLSDTHPVNMDTPLTLLLFRLLLLLLRRLRLQVPLSEFEFSWSKISDIQTQVSQDRPWLLVRLTLVEQTSY